jgi:hypothetical protein
MENFRLTSAYAQLSSRVRTGRMLVFHGEPSRSSQRASDRRDRDVAAGLFPEDWAGDFEALGEFGEA